jgi:hypothetical protein
MGHKTKSEQLHEELNEFAEIFSPNPRYNDVSTEIDFSAKFNELYIQSLKDLYFWQYCPFKVYELTYKRRLEEYQLLHPDALEIDFCLHELKKINEYIKPVELTYYHEKSTSGESFFYYMLSSEFYEKAIQLDFLPEIFYLDFKYSTQCKINFLESLVKELKDKQKFALSDEITPPIFPTEFNKIQLKNIYESSIKELIKCSEADFLYWFAGIGKSGRKIKWLKRWGKEPHKAALYWYCKQMNPKVTPGMINSVFDIEVHKKHDTANEGSYPEINSIFNGL